MKLPQIRKETNKKVGYLTEKGHRCLGRQRQMRCDDELEIRKWPENSIFIPLIIRN